MKTSNQLRLSPSANMQALMAQARRAAAISVVERQSKGDRKVEQRKQVKKNRQLTPLQLSVRSIVASVSAYASEGTTLVNEKLDRYSSAHAIISLYSDDDIEAHRLAKERRKTDPNVKVPKLCPIIRYVFYSSILDASQLGSIAIYCVNARALHDTISKTGYLFGIPVKQATLEIGMSQYIDVVFRA